MAEAGQEPTADSNGLSQGGNKYRQIFGLKAVHLLAVFAFIYVGVEVTLGGQKSIKPHFIFTRFFAFRLDRYIHHPRATWRTQYWIYFFRFLWWYVSTRPRPRPRPCLFDEHFIFRIDPRTIMLNVAEQDGRRETCYCTIHTNCNLVSRVTTLRLAFPHAFPHFVLSLEFTIWFVPSIVGNAVAVRAFFLYSFPTLTMLTLNHVSRYP